MNVSAYRRSLNKLVLEYQTAESGLKRDEAPLHDAKRKLESIQIAQQICQEIAEGVQESAHSQISGLVSRCLDTVFGEGIYGFRIKFEKKRGKTEAFLIFMQGDHELDPVEAGSGGVMDVAAFALRLACLVLSKPQRRRLIVADEPFKAVGKDRLPYVRDLLESLAREMEIQIVIVSHSDMLSTGRVINLE